MHPSRAPSAGRDILRELIEVRDDDIRFCADAGLYCLT